MQRQRDGGKARRVGARDCAQFDASPGMDCRRTPGVALRSRRAGARRPLHRGGLSFGYFSLATQRKVTRPHGRRVKYGRDAALRRSVKKTTKPYPNKRISPSDKSRQTTLPKSPRTTAPIVTRTNRKIETGRRSAPSILKPGCRLRPPFERGIVLQCGHQILLGYTEHQEHRVRYEDR